MIDLAELRRDPDRLRLALARRHVDAATFDSVVDLDVRHRHQQQAAEQLRARVKELSRQVGEARRGGDAALAASLADESRALGEDERLATATADEIAESLRAQLLDLPNVPADEAPDGDGEVDNVVLRRWWPGVGGGAPEPTYGDHQRVAHWDVGRELGILDLEAGVAMSGSMFPLFRGDGARLTRALTAYALSLHADAYEEIRPPTLVLTETMVATGHLPKSAMDMYAIERDGLWTIPTAEVPLTSMCRNQILDVDALPLRLSAYTPCFRREAGAAGRDTRGVLRTHEFDKVELFAYCTPDQAQGCFDDILSRAEGILRDLQLQYRVVDLCVNDMSNAAARTFDLEVYAPGVDMWLEVSSTSWFRDFQARRANVRFRTASGATQLVHTVNGSALAWSRIWPTIIETYRQPDGSVTVPDVLVPFLGGRRRIAVPAP